MQFPCRQLGRNIKPRLVLPLTMPFSTDEAESSQPRVVITCEELSCEHQLNFEIFTNSLETATRAATQVAYTQLAKCATPFFAQVHTTPLIHFSIKLNKLPIKMFCKCLTYVNSLVLRATWILLLKLQLPGAMFLRAPPPQIVSKRV